LCASAITPSKHASACPTPIDESGEVLAASRTRINTLCPKDGSQASAPGPPPSALSDSRRRSDRWRAPPLPFRAPSSPTPPTPDPRVRSGSFGSSPEENLTGPVRFPDDKDGGPLRLPSLLLDIPTRPSPRPLSSPATGSSLPAPISLQRCPRETNPILANRPLPDGPEIAPRSCQNEPNSRGTPGVHQGRWPQSHNAPTAPVRRTERTHFVAGPTADHLPWSCFA
jgi:hypothetical protein